MTRRYVTPGRPLKKTRKERVLENGGSHTKQQWLEVKERFSNTCLRCGRVEGSWNGWIGDYVKLEADHVVPVEKGGSSNIENIQPLCKSCNASKGNRDETDYRLLFQEVK